MKKIIILLVALLGMSCEFNTLSVSSNAQIFPVINSDKVDVLSFKYYFSGMSLNVEEAKKSILKSYPTATGAYYKSYNSMMFIIIPRNQEGLK